MKPKGTFEFTQLGTNQGFTPTQYMKLFTHAPSPQRVCIHFSFNIFQD